MADIKIFVSYYKDTEMLEETDIIKPIFEESEDVTVLPILDEGYEQKIGLNDRDISACVDGYDVILPAPVDVTLFGSISNEVQFSTLDNLHAVDFDLTCRTILELYSEYEKAVAEFRNVRYAYWYNMFIMKKELFSGHCRFLFDVLKNVEEKIDFTYFTEREIQSRHFCLNVCSAYIC